MRRLRGSYRKRHTSRVRPRGARPSKIAASPRRSLCAGRRDFINGTPLDACARTCGSILCFGNAAADCAAGSATALHNAAPARWQRASRRRGWRRIAWLNLASFRIYALSIGNPPVPVHAHSRDPPNVALSEVFKICANTARGRPRRARGILHRPKGPREVPEGPRQGRAEGRDLARGARARARAPAGTPAQSSGRRSSTCPCWRVNAIADPYGVKVH